MASPVSADADSDVLRLRHLLKSVEDAPPGAVVEVVARHLLNSLQASEVSFLLADLSGEALVPITRMVSEGSVEITDHVESVPIHDSHAGIALRRQRTQVVRNGKGACVYAPVTTRGDAIGVLQLHVPKSPLSSSIEKINATAHALAYVVIANRRHTDLFEWGQRTRPMTLAGEIQRRLTPSSFVCEAGQFTLAGWLEPTVESAGDTFDYSFNETAVTCSLTDAMGHSVNAALLATLAVSALRNTRQSGAGIAEAAAAANDALLQYAGDGQFVTGILVNVLLADGTATVVNAGHPSPYLFRGGEVIQVPLEVELPFGISRSAAYHAQKIDLQAGDRLILVTDGLLERNAADFDIASLVGRSARLHAREFVRELCRAVTAAAGGFLHDDATVLCLDWHGDTFSVGCDVAVDYRTQ